MSSTQKSTPVVRAFKSGAPSYISYFTSKGQRINLLGGFIKTDDPDVIACLEEQVKNPYSEMVEIDPAEVPDTVRQAPRTHQIELNSSDTISPADLLARVRAHKEAQEAQSAETSQVLEAAARANVGITSSAKMNGNAVESNAAQAGKK